MLSRTGGKVFAFKAEVLLWGGSLWEAFSEEMRLLSFEGCMPSGEVRLVSLLQVRGLERKDRGVQEKARGTFEVKTLEVKV